MKCISRNFHFRNLAFSLIRIHVNAHTNSYRDIQWTTTYSSSIHDNSDYAPGGGGGIVNQPGGSDVTLSTYNMVDSSSKRIPHGRESTFFCGGWGGKRKESIIYGLSRLMSSPRRGCKSSRDSGVGVEISGRSRKSMRRFSTRCLEVWSSGFFLSINK